MVGGKSVKNRCSNVDFDKQSEEKIMFKIKLFSWTGFNITSSMHLFSPMSLDVGIISSWLHKQPITPESIAGSDLFIALPSPL